MKICEMILLRVKTHWRKLPFYLFQTQRLTQLAVDASGFCIGAVLQQSQNGSPQPLAFWSKALTETQKSWSAFDRELYACFSSTKHFHYFLDSHHFVLKTDHKPVVHKLYDTATPLQVLPDSNDILITSRK